MRGEEVGKQGCSLCGDDRPVGTDDHLDSPSTHGTEQLMGMRVDEKEKSAHSRRRTLDANPREVVVGVICTLTRFFGVEASFASMDVPG